MATIIAPVAPMQKPEKSATQIADLKAWLTENQTQTTKNQNSCDLHHSQGCEQISFDIPAIDEKLDGGLKSDALHEVRCPLARDSAAGIAFVLGLLTHLKNQSGKFLWVKDPTLNNENAILYPPGLAEFGLPPERLVMASPISLQTALWTADEAAKCNELSAMVLHLKGNPKSFDMTATRRLMLRAQTSKTLCIVLRQSGEEEASAVATRWRVQSAISKTHPNFHRSIGNMRLALSLERKRNGQTGHWTLCWNHKTQAFQNVSATVHTHPANHQDQQRPAHPFHYTAIPANRQNHTRSIGKIVAFGNAS